MQPRKAHSFPIIACAFGVLTALLSWLQPTVTQPIDVGTARQWQGKAYSVPLDRALPGKWVRALIGVESDGNGQIAASQLALFENGRSLGPPHSLHARIVQEGGGRYSHWGDQLIFAASDNSNPAYNGRTYAIAYPIKPPTWVPFGALALAAVLSGLLSRVRLQPLAPRTDAASAGAGAGAVDVESPAPSPYRADIDGLRAVAVLCVLGFHAFPSIVTGGFVGVDVFFVISGYLISSVILAEVDRGSFSFVDFYSRRIRRIFPALAVTLLTTMAAGWFLLLAADYEELGKHVAAGAAFVSNLMLWSETGYFDTAAEAKPLLHLWSLGIEEQFYIVWPGLLWLSWKRKWNRLRVITVVCAASFALGVWTLGHDRTAAFYSPLTRFWELTMGSLVAVSRPPSGGYAVHPRRYADLLACLGAALVLGAALFLDRQVNFPGWWALAPVLGTALILLGAQRAWLNRTALSHPLAVYIGLMSYPLYLWHWPLIAFLRLSEGGEPSPALRVAALVAAGVLAWMTYRWVEKPIRFGGHDVRKTALALFAVMLITGAVGYVCYLSRGVPSRPDAKGVMPEHEIKRLKARYDGVDTRFRYESGSPKVVVYGDSQAFDLFAALRNDPYLGAAFFSSTYQCSGFDNARKGEESFAQACRESFDALLRSPEIRAANVLVYAHMFYPDKESLAQHRLGIERLREANPGLAIVLAGNKACIGSSYASLNAITKAHRSVVGMNEYLNGMRDNPDPENRVSARTAAELGVEFLDVEGVFCDANCPFYVNDTFSYFDQDHWTEAGALLFYTRFRETQLYRTTFSKPKGTTRAP